MYNLFRKPFKGTQSSKVQLHIRENIDNTQPTTLFLREKWTFHTGGHYMLSGPTMD